MSEFSQKQSNTVSSFDVHSIKADFPILQQQVNGHPLVYLDNAATTQKPEMVIEAISHYYRHDNANVHRGSHTLSDRATARFESARDAVAGFINSPASCQVIWVRGVTEGINLVAHSWGRSNLQAGDKVLVPWLEHHADIVPGSWCAPNAVPNWCRYPFLTVVILTSMPLLNCLMSGSRWSR